MLFEMRERSFSELRKFVAPEFVFGVGALDQVSGYARRFQVRKALVVTDQGVENAGWAKRVTDNLSSEDIPYVLFDGITPNPKDTEVMKGADVYRSAECNIIVAVGGGSVLDCAKGIGIVVSNYRHIISFEGVDQIGNPIPPLICIPTTGGTSADVSQFAIITNTSDKVKIAIISKAVVPDVALIDPETLLTMDPYLTACTGVDALVHAIEAYVSSAHSSITDIHALNAIKLINDNLIKTINEPSDVFYREKVMQGSLEAGLAFSNASLGAVHAMAHSLGGYFDLPHGECNAMLLMHVMNFNYQISAQRYLDIGNAFGLNLYGYSKSQIQKHILDYILDFNKNVGITQTLKEKGVNISDIPILAKKAVLDACLITNPRDASVDDLKAIYRESL